MLRERTKVRKVLQQIKYVLNSIYVQQLGIAAAGLIGCGKKRGHCIRTEVQLGVLLGTRAISRDFAVSRFISKRRQPQSRN